MYATFKVYCSVSKGRIIFITCICFHMHLLAFNWKSHLLPILWCCKSLGILKVERKHQAYPLTEPFRANMRIVFWTYWCDGGHCGFISFFIQSLFYWLL